MRRGFRIGVMLAALVMGAARLAHATPVSIGEFDYDFVPATDDAVSFGPIFTVSNFSDALPSGGDDFTNLVLHLQQDQSDVAAVPFFDTFVSAEASTSTGPESLANYTFNRAYLSFDFGPQGTITIVPAFLSDLTTAEEQHLTSFILFEPPTDTTPNPVPEPATILLTFVGGAAGFVRRRRTREIS